MPDTFTFTEALWTLLGLVGMLISGLNLWDAILDFRAVRELPTWNSRREGLWVMGRASVRSEVLRFSKMATVAAIGLIAGLTTPPLPPGTHLPTWTPVTITITLGLVYIVVVIVLQAWLDRQVRKHFLDRERGR